MKKIKVPSGSPFEDAIGFSRGVRAGNYISISGTAPIAENGKTEGVGDPAKQARRCFEIIKRALEKVEANLTDVIRTRILLKRIKDWEKVAEVHAEYFRVIKPATSVFEVANFINPDWLIEIEVDAYVSEQ